MKKFDLRSMKSNMQVSSNVPEASDTNPLDQAQSFLMQYQGRSQNELIDEVRTVAAREKAAGNLSNEKMDHIANTLAPMMSDEQRMLMQNLIQQLKGN